MSAHSSVHRRRVSGLLALSLIAALVLTANLPGLAAPLSQVDAPSQPPPRSPEYTISLAPGAEAYRFVTLWGFRFLPRIAFDFDGPGGVAVDPAGNIYVADTGHNRIEKFTADSGPVTGWGSAGNGDGEFSAPEFLAVDQAGYLSGISSEWTSLALDSAGNVHISYHDRSNTTLKYATNSGAFGQ